MKPMLKNILAIALTTLAAGAPSASADVKIEFSKEASDANVTKVVFNFDFAGMAPTGQQMNDIFTNAALPIVSSAEDKGLAQSLVIRGGDPKQSRKVLYVQTGGKPTKVEIFHPDLSVRGNADLNTGFSWVVGDGYFAVDETLLNKKTFKGTFYIRKPLAEVIHPDALGKTITNGKVTISSKN